VCGRAGGKECNTEDGRAALFGHQARVVADIEEFIQDRLLRQVRSRPTLGHPLTIPLAPKDRV